MPPARLRGVAGKRETTLNMVTNTSLRIVTLSIFQHLPQSKTLDTVVVSHFFPPEAVEVPPVASTCRLRLPPCMSLSGPRSKSSSLRQLF